MKHSLKKQQGTAALFTVLLLPGFLAMMYMTIEATRYMQDEAKIGDAMEATALAVSGNVDKNIDTNKALVKRYADLYLPDANVQLENINVEVQSCEDVYGARCGEPGVYDRHGFYFSEFRISATVSQQSWFPISEKLPGFDETINFDGKAVARKYIFDPLDLILVLDMSGSMGNAWSASGSDQDKYQGVLDIVERLATDIHTLNQEIADVNKRHRIGVSVFSDRVVHKEDTAYGTRYFRSSYLYQAHEDNWRYKYAAQSTLMNNLFNDSYFGIYTSQSSDSTTFYNIDLTKDLPALINQVKYFTPSGYTASFEGIVAGARMLYGSLEPDVKRKKVLIILSDGEDYGRDYYGYYNHKWDGINLYNAGMCNAMRDAFIAQDAQLTLAVIGFDYDLERNQGLKTCVGEKNVHTARDYDDIYNTIVPIIAEAVGHLFYRDYQAN